MKLHSSAARGDLAELRELLGKGLPVDARDEQDYTPLGRALSSSSAGVDAARLLISAGANVNARVDDMRRHLLDLAAASGDLDKVRALLEAGADIKSVSAEGYSVLVHALCALHHDDRLLPMMECLIHSGAELDQETSFSESPLSVASLLGRFDAVKLLLDAGADPMRLRWNGLMRSIVLGTLDNMKSELESGESLNDVDSFGRNALLLACLTGDVSKVQLLYSAGANLNRPSPGGRTPLMHCAERDKPEVLRWLADRGADVNTTDDSDTTALMIAAETGSDGSVRVLLEAGADPRPHNEYGENAMGLAVHVEIVRMLCEAGEDLTDVNSETRRRILGLSDHRYLKLTQEDYKRGKHPRFGTSNPEVIDIAFWNEMVRVGCSAWQGRAAFDDTDDFDSGAVWCFDRFGMTFTMLPDGRFVQMGGEHEDFYDPDFHIYNDVIVHRCNGTFQIMGYPKDLFPPTDFHTATFVDGQIYILGGLGYAGSRKYGFTPCYRLNCENWQIESIETTGDNPGWIFQHNARLDGTNAIVISGGKICELRRDDEVHLENKQNYRLDLTGMTWQRV